MAPEGSGAYSPHVSCTAKMMNLCHYGEKDASLLLVEAQKDRMQ